MDREATLTVMGSSAEHDALAPGTLGSSMSEAESYRVLNHDGDPVHEEALPDPTVQLDLYRNLVIARRLDQQATLLAKQGRLAVYPSVSGQEACQVGAVAALHETDWLFPTYRDTIALLVRGIPAADALALMRGDQHCGYDPLRYSTAPQSTPLATQLLHAVGLAYAAQLAGDPVVALAFCGDGATSEGDFHEALNLAAVQASPAVFFIQNNGYAISVPLTQQTAAPTLAHKAIGYGMPGRRVDGNDVLAVWTVVTDAVERARVGHGPSLIEAVTYRVGPHTNADDPSRYRDASEAEPWRRRDPVKRLERHLLSSGLMNTGARDDVAAEAEQAAEELRCLMSAEPRLDPLRIFDHVMSQPTPQLRAQRALLSEELEST